MLGHEWQPAEGTCLEIRQAWNGGTTTSGMRFLVEVRPADGEPFTVELRTPDFAGQFKTPQKGQVFAMKADVKRQKARFDTDDPTLSWKTDHRQQKAEFDEALASSASPPSAAAAPADGLEAMFSASAPIPSDPGTPAPEVLATTSLPTTASEVHMMSAADAAPFLSSLLGGQGAVVGAPAAPGGGDVAARLAVLDGLHAQGSVTDEEYQAKRQSILDAL